MSLCHLRLIKVYEDNRSIEYIVESPDFETKNEWAEMGKLHIDILKKDYEFHPSTLIKTIKFIPPEIYKIEHEQRKLLLETKYKGYGWGIWAMAINHYAKFFIEKNEYPKCYPSLFCKDIL